MKLTSVIIDVRNGIDVTQKQGHLPTTIKVWGMGMWELSCEIRGR